MTKKYKYLLNMGLAFDEERAMKKLSEMAKKGWILEKMTMFRYKLVKSEPTDLVYTMDYKRLDQDENEYFELFEDSGWKHMCSYYGFHFFAGLPGVVPIYTDKKSYIEKYRSYKQGCIKSVLISSLVLLISYLFMDTVGSKIELLRDILKLIYILSFVVLVPSMMMLIAYIIREKKSILK